MKEQFKYIGLLLAFTMTSLVCRSLLDGRDCVLLIDIK